MAGRRYFTLEEANRLVPRIAPLMARAMQIHLQLRRTVSDLEKAGVEMTQELIEPEGPAAVPEESQPLLSQARALYATVLDEIKAIEALGADVKGLEHGLADFWSLLDGETEVLLCWQLGERRIDHFHLPDAGFPGRQPVRGRAFLAERRKARP